MDNNQSIPPTLDSSIARAKTYIREHWDEGVDCPCCGRLVKLYDRKITSAMAYGLILLYKHIYGKPNNLQPTHMENFFKKADCPSSIRGDFSKFKYWGVIEEVPELGAGYYRLTRRGYEFVKGNISIPRVAKVYNDTVYGFSEDFTNISVALGDKFNFEELMGYEVRSKDTKRDSLSSQQDIFQ